jgi:hypothetical protein
MKVKTILEMGCGGPLGSETSRLPYSLELWYFNLYFAFLQM